jgi:hypothetical protein
MFKGGRSAAKFYVQHGLSPVPGPRGKKKCVLKEWPTLRVTEANLDEWFPTEKLNVLILNGSPSGGLLDVDLDCDEAKLLAAAFLPPTTVKFGHGECLTAHWYYRVDGSCETIRCLDVPVDGNAGEVLSELRSDGTGTMWPGSVHPNGEMIEFESFGDPPVVSTTTLKKAVGRLFAATLLTRHLPRAKGRQNAAMALAGGLLLGGMPDEEAEAFIEAVATAAGDEEAAKRKSAIFYTRRALGKGSAISNWAALGKIVGETVVERVRVALGMELKVTGAAIVDHKPESRLLPLGEAAYHGPVGEYVRLVEPHTEADSAAILVQCLVGFGNIIGRDAHFDVEATRHGLNEFALLVGPTGVGRKGTSTDQALRLLKKVDADWSEKRIRRGLSTGEGLINAVRDDSVQHASKPDQAATDKRLMVIEPEFGKVLRQFERQGNVLSPVLRDAWDGNSLEILTKKEPLRATGAHISFIGHVTEDELRKMTMTEYYSGFANRFLWLYVKRSKILPSPSQPSARAVEEIAKSVRAARVHAGAIGTIRRSKAARALWAKEYERLTSPPPGIRGAILARGDAHVSRLSAIYAVLGQSVLIEPVHLLAALAIWDYTCQSVDYVISLRSRQSGSLATGDEKKILEALQRAGRLKRRDVMRLLGNNRLASEIDALRDGLVGRGLIRLDQVTTDGRPAEVWVLL